MAAGIFLGIELEVAVRRGGLKISIQSGYTAISLSPVESLMCFGRPHIMQVWYGMVWYSQRQRIHAHISCKFGALTF